MGFETYVKMPSKRASLSLYRGPVWDLDGVCLPGLMTEKVYLGSFVGPRWH